jgi:hypothetical protein
VRCWLVIVLLLFAGSKTAHAHLASDSYLYIAIDAAGRVEGQWDIALRDLDVSVGLDADQNGTITWGELRTKQADIENYAFGRLALSRGAETCRIIPAALMVDYHAGSAYAVMPFGVKCPAAGELTLRYRLLFDLDPSHRGLLTIDAGNAVRSDVLTPDHAEVTLAHGSQQFADRTLQFLRLGFDHILLGYDHLLFVALLMVTAALRRNEDGSWIAIDGFYRVLVEAFKTLTAFTLAHAAVLTPAALGLVNVPARFVEPAVAATIVLAGMDNVRPILPSLRWRVAFLFGLIHGMSFATALGPMRLAPADLAFAVSLFNLGIEGGQIALALLLVPTVFVVREESVYGRVVVPTISIAGAGLAGLWIINRIFELDLLALQSFSTATVGR